MNNSNNSLMIRVFPNSGHQYEVIKLTKLLHNWSKEKITTFVEKNIAAWEPWDAFTPWIRYRYENMPWEQGGPILRLAVETNLGTPSNGLLFDSEEVGDDIKTEEKENPYASYDEANIEEDFGRNRCIPLTYLPNIDDREIEINITIHWIRSTGADPVQVDLVVDLGNTRTVALLLEHPSHESIPFGHRVQPVRFMPPGDSYKVQNFNGSGIAFDELSIIDSWFVLKRSNFSEMEPPFGIEKVLTVDSASTEESTDHIPSRRKVLKYIANTFVEMSPALIGGGNFNGGARAALAQAPLDEDARFTMGSPKRYAWDDRTVGTSGSSYWSQLPNLKNEENDRPFYFEKLDGLFRLFMDPEGKDWDVNGTPKESDLANAPFRNSPPNFPRRDSICWFAMSVLESAYRQINSDNYLNVAKRRTLPRKLSKVSVLYPSGWTKLEKNEYFDQWKRALKIFTTTHLSCNEQINLNSMDNSILPTFEERGLDEAMCAQLPVVYSEVTSLGGAGKEWLNLYGNGKKTRVMNIDIGGGTTDFSVIEYRKDDLVANDSNQAIKRNDPTAKLLAKLLYKDGKSIAGDTLVKKIIEDLLIPEWILSSVGPLENLDQKIRNWIAKMFEEPESIVFADVDPRLPAKVARIVRLVFLPVVNNLLAKLGDKGSGDDKIEIDIAELVNGEILDSLNEITNEMLDRKTHDCNTANGNIFSNNKTLHFNRSLLEQVIDDVFAELFDDLLQIFREFPCDLVILSGKPSELSRIRDRIEEGLPLLPQRIINLKNYMAGEWYPFAEKGRVTDAKTAAVVGAALHQDILNGNLRGFSLREEPHLEQMAHYWGTINQNLGLDEFFKNLLFDKRKLVYGKESIVDCEIPIGCILGRKSFRNAKSSPEPVYQLCYDDNLEEENGSQSVRLKLRWSIDEDKGEHLELLEVLNSSSDHNLDLNKIKLKLRTQMDETHWLDSPKFKIKSLATA